ncbi:MAG TPA: acetyl-CoA C-acyltransferase [Sediminibacterium sp.]|jgi:acetyl-CoA acyltransferase|uniref:acetyl-CoA C-acyltransferase n=1 Tax=Sediminibacterium sp. TaxID=1917865 RepID=UPI0008C05556|nr:acetyl-CoA C-acyltransferase [Sediminibacterium sp.]OHC86765.1 MAG: acetyl-CoA acetyltransferase [Sphingobacteriia bacterium RIFOXYC2_FULL_35_18]OHC88376.1 MAG: acetyl-CoA acetyltransferase [Sphingobacteriia bacterium RIFOXYD2_FULL_35_12]OYY10725.1 MAG: acetyl-CoA acetyltransferase [Sphingobacteriia bacterium 35-36-14]OYZ54068.1 MAG: acetyl-CoA acetyltransferase [Sphingobacteriia bacterium 24-36-13]OZA65302.1 MAG: acetyl-CoA acetyltransferase [Sphingobacteriia bacterium 39-36-14]
MQEAYIVAGFRTAVTKSKRGGFRFFRPDDLAVEVIKGLMASVPQLDSKLVDDVIVGNAVPEAEQGLQFGRIIAAKALGIEVAGITINRYCASGLESIATATAKIRSGMAECIIAGGTESMSLVPTAGWKTVPSYAIAKEEPDYYLSMGLTAEAVAKEFNISREDQDAFAYASHMKAKTAIENGYFKSGILPIAVEETYVNEKGKKAVRSYTVDTDEGLRADTTVEGLSKLKAAFAVGGSVTAGNSSQTSDGAAFALVMSERMMLSLGLTPIGRLVNCASAGVHPRIMGIGPVAAIPKVLKQAGMNLGDIDLFELNEAFASQSLAVIRELGLDTTKVNINGGAIALGHPLGCTGCKLTVQLLNDMKRLNKKFGMVTACVGGGQGIAGIIENL